MNTNDVIQGRKRGYVVQDPPTTTRTTIIIRKSNLPQDQEAKHFHTTKSKTTPTIQADGATDLAPPLGTKSDVVCSSILAANNLGSYSDQSKFPIQSSIGNLYIFILYHYNKYSIHDLSLPKRHAATSCEPFG